MCTQFGPLADHISLLYLYFLILHVYRLKMLTLIFFSFPSDLKMMPSKRIKVGSNGKFSVADLHNPRVILRPLRADSSGHTRCHFVTEPPIASLYNKPELSDIKLIVGDNSYYAHRLVLCAASEVFSRMLGTNWLESKKSELELREEDECVKIFDRFLEYIYTGSILISESYAIPLFLLADKYNIKPLYGECVKVIENGLKVYIVSRSQSTPEVEPSKPTPSTSAGNPSMSYVLASRADAYSSDTDSDCGESPATVPQVPQPSASKSPSDPHSIHLVAIETFPLSLVLKMLTYCHNDRIASAALYNLQARLASQIKHNNYGVWNDLDQELLLRILKDDHFCCPEYILFKAAKSWLAYDESRNSEEVVSEVLSCIRYPILSADELYVIEKDDVIRECMDADRLVRQAIRYKLFQNCSQAIQSEEWGSKQYQPRLVKET